MRKFVTALVLTLLLSGLALAQASSFDPFEATIPQMRAALSSGAITCKQLVQYYLDRMDALDIAGPKLNAVRTRNPNALQIADAMDHQPDSIPRGPLFCIPVLVKDNIDALDMPTTAGSVALQNTLPLDDSFLVKQLKAAGAIIIAKGNLTEFANFLTAGMPTGYSSLGGYCGFEPVPPDKQENNREEFVAAVGLTPQRAFQDQGRIRAISGAGTRNQVFSGVSIEILDGLEGTA